MTACHRCYFCARLITSYRYGSDLKRMISIRRTGYIGLLYVCIWQCTAYCSCGCLAPQQVSQFTEKSSRVPTISKGRNESRRACWESDPEKRELWVKKFLHGIWTEIAFLLLLILDYACTLAHYYNPPANYKVVGQVLGQWVGLGE